MTIDELVSTSKNELVIRCCLEAVSLYRWHVTIRLYHTGRKFYSLTYRHNVEVPTLDKRPENTGFFIDTFSDITQGARLAILDWHNLEAWKTPRPFMGVRRDASGTHHLIPSSHIALLGHYARLELLLAQCWNRYKPDTLIHYRFGGFFQAQYRAWYEVGERFSK